MKWRLIEAGVVLSRALPMLLATAALTALAASHAAAQQASLSLRVTELGGRNPAIPGVNVRVLDAEQREIAKGLTDGKGTFTVKGLSLGQTVLIEYRLFGYLRDPRQMTVSVDAPQKIVDGWLLSKTDGSEAYLNGAARRIDELARQAPTPDAKKARYEEAWEVVAELPPASQRIVAARISDTQHLAGSPTFNAALRLERSGAIDAKADAAARAAAAGAAAARVDVMDKSDRRLVYEVTLSEDQGNFKFGRTELPDEAKARIDEVISRLKADPKGVFIEIEGHTDDVGAKDINERIGLELAEAVKRYIYESHQVPLHKINVISYGEDKPVAPNKTRAGRAQNRRIVIRVLS